ncbi:chromate efflux transporter [Bacillus sanguinis]
MGFTLPSVLVLVFFASFFNQFDFGSAGWIHGLKLVAVAIVAHAIWGMAQKLTPDRNRATIAIATAAIALLWPSSWTQVILIIISGFIGWFLYRNQPISQSQNIKVPISKKIAVSCLVLFFGLLLLLPILRPFSYYIALFDSFYRSGALVFGGGHVVLPLLEGEFVQNGMMTKEQFLAGYGLTQAMPGPLFTFASYIGAVLNGTLGAILATIAIFLPAFLLVIGVLPFWDSVRKISFIQGALLGVNAAVVGILIAAFLRSHLDEHNYKRCRFCFCISSILLARFLENTTLGYRYTWSLWRIYSIHFVNKKRRHNVAVFFLLKLYKLYSFRQLTLC